MGGEWRCLWWAVSGGAYIGRSVEVPVVGGEWRCLWWAVSGGAYIGR